MRFAFMFIAVVLAGCATPQPAERDAVTTATKSVETNGNPAEKKEAPKSTVTLDETVLGRVVRVDPKLRFVVMDFPIRRIPALDQRLNIYRDGQKVAEVKVTGPTRDTVVAGDIVTGEVQTGDEVRED